MADQDQNYLFVAQDARTGETSRKRHAQVWHKLTQAVKQSCKLFERKHPNWTEWEPHAWASRVVPDRRKFVAWDGDIVAGFLNVRINYKSVLEPDSPVLYIEHLGTFPGNLSTRLWERRLKETGPALLAFAAKEAASIGANRISLHADAEAVSWYDKMNDKFGGLFEYRMTGVQGPYPVNVGQLYFESSVIGAQTLLASYRDD
jgi:hypothetical protein